MFCLCLALFLHVHVTADSRSISVTYSDDGVETLITDHCDSLTSQLNQLTSELKGSHLKGYTGLAALQESSKHISAHMRHNEMFIAGMLAALHEASHSLNELNKTIVHKIEEEHLETWLERPIKMQGSFGANNV